MSELSAAHAILGARVAAARRDRGMTQRELAQALGVSAWTVDRIESGYVDPGRYIPSIADVTDASTEWFAIAEGARHLRARALPLPHLGVAGRDLVLGSIVLLVTIRLLTEVVAVLPRAANFIDIPIFLVLAFAAMSMTAGQPGPHTYALAYRPLPSRCSRSHPPLSTLSVSLRRQ